eukprot:TRINITY_DN10432_c0_g2_i1.p1 TRINITY_DN10432_c0_g2~~TRINITY_DN10432_c0_g2_i1.p1  ORF type:complete len:219 (+),score=43.70 TRINITY_DN10432_c0_g2_i1:643-1299(+)
MIVKKYFPKRKKKPNTTTPVQFFGSDLDPKIFDVHDDTTDDRPEKARDFKFVLLEAVPSGVKIFDLEKRLDFYREGAILGIRRIKFPRTRKIERELYRFVKHTLGTPYANLATILKLGIDMTSSGREAKEGEDGDGKEKTALFCSQLLALGFQKIGFLDSSVNAATVLPCHFAPAKGNTEDGGDERLPWMQPLDRVLRIPQVTRETRMFLSLVEKQTQ